MIRKKKIQVNQDGSYSYNFTTKSGKVFLNENNRLKKDDSQKNKQSYNPIDGNLVTKFGNNYLFNDNLSIHFNKNNNNNELINISTYLSGETINKLENSMVYNGSSFLNRNNLNNLLATPSTLSNIEINPSTLNQPDIIEKFITPFTYKQDFNSKFNDNKQYDFSNLSRFDFINLNDNYEYTSIDIELNNLFDVILQHTAAIQENDLNSSVVLPNETDTKYTFQYADVNTTKYDRLNTPFVLYNFSNGCFEYRGLQQPVTQFSEIWVSNDNVLRTSIVPFKDNNFIGGGDIPILKLPYMEVSNEFNDLNRKFFRKYFEKYIMQQDCITNTPINFLADDFGSEDHLNYSYYSIPSNQFGFPFFNVKYNLFDDNLLNMSQFINKPFVIDKISLNLDIQCIGEIVHDTDTNSDLNYLNGLNMSLNYGILSRQQIKDENVLNTRTKIKPFIANKTLDKYDILDNDNSPITSELVYENPLNPYVIRTLNKFEYNFQNLNDYKQITKIENDKFYNNLITYGNILINSKKDDLNENVRKKMIQNSDLFLSIPSLSTPVESTAANYSTNVNFTTFVRKNSLHLKKLNAHNLNYQFELPTLQDTSVKQQAYLTRNGLGSLNGRDVLNAQSYSDNLLSYTTFKNRQKFINNIELDPYPLLYDFNDILQPQTLSLDSNYLNNNERNYSPYVLMPNDKIAFYFSISPTITPTIIKQLIKLKKGKIKFTLHGYIPKNNEKVVDWKNLKNLNQKNLTSTISPNNTFITDNYTNSTYLVEYINSYYDRIFDGNFFRDPPNRQLLPSKILTGLSYIPYLKPIENILNSWIYDDDKLSDIIKDISNPYPPTPELNQVFKNMTNLKYSVLSRKIASPFIFSQRNFGQFHDMIEQRKYTTSIDINKKIQYVIEQIFLDEEGTKIDDMTDSRLPYNKSRYLQLIDSKGQYYTTQEYLDLKHVAFRDVR